MMDSLSQPPRTFAFDLDGSLLRSDGSVSDRTRKAIDRIRLDGDMVVLATGRPTRQVRAIADDIGHTGLSVCSNGAVVYDHWTDQMVYTRLFEYTAIHEIIRVARAIRDDLTVAAECLSGLVAEPGFPAAGTTLATTNPAAATEVLQLLLHSDHGMDDELAAAMRSALAGLAEVTWGTPSGPLEVTLVGVDKAVGVRQVLAMTGRDTRSLIAFGDMPNDLALLRAARLPYAMANAHPDVLAAVPFRAPANDDDGIAAVLETLYPPQRNPAHVVEPHRISFAVAAHPRRLAWVTAMRDKHPELELDIVLDPSPDGPPIAMRTARLAWSSVPTHASHRLVLQDDVTLCPGFSSAAHAVVSAAPSDAISLFAEWGSRAGMSLRIAGVLGYSFSAVANNYVPTQGLIMPAEVARGFDRYVAECEPSTAEDDLAMARYLERYGVQSRIALPNLVEHSEQISLVGNDFTGTRLSTCFADDGIRPGNWDRRVFIPRLVPFFCGRTETARCLVLDGARRADWRTMSVSRVLHHRGVAAHMLDFDLQEALERHPNPHLVRENVKLAHLVQAWSMSYLLGSVLAEELSEADDPIGAFELALDNEWAESALATLAPGAMRSFVRAEFLPALQELLLDGVRTALFRAAVPAASAGRMTA